MSDLVTFVATCLTAVGGTLLLSSNPQGASLNTLERARDFAVHERNVVQPSFARQGRLFVTATINDHKVNLMIDTGASHTVLSRRDADRLGIDGARDVKVQALGGMHTVREAYAGEITLDDKTMHDWPVLISDTTDVSLLGMDLLTRMGGTHIALQPLS